MEQLSIARPAIQGLNTIDALADSDGVFALQLDQFVFDREGRLASKEPWNDNGTAVSGATSITFAHEWIPEAGAFFGLPVNLFANELGIYDVDVNALTLSTTLFATALPGVRSTGDGTGYAHGVNFDGQAYIWQKGAVPKVTTDTLTLNDVAITANPVPPAGVAHFAFGHMFAADTSPNGLIAGSVEDCQTLYWSDYRDPTNWNNSQDLTTLFNRPDDCIVGITDHNGFLIVLCRHCILVFDFGSIDLGTLTPVFSAATLKDRIDGIGCVHQNSIQNTGDDLLWLGFGGIYSFGRVIQEKSNPLGSISTLLQPDIQDRTAAAGLGPGTRSIQSAWWPEKRWYLLSFPHATETYVFDFNLPTSIGTPRATRWNDFAITAFIDETRVGLTTGGFATGIEPFMRGAVIENGGPKVTRYSPRFKATNATTSYLGDSVWRMPMMDMGAPDREKHLKNCVLAATSMVDIDCKVESFQNYDDQTVQWTNTQGLDVVSFPKPQPMPLGGSGQLVQLLLTFTHNEQSSTFAIQRVSIQFKAGRIGAGVY